MNKCIHMGRLTADPEVRYNADMAIARYTLAVDRRGKKDQDQTADFLRVVAFGKAAEFAEKYLKKGIKIVLTSHVQTGSYEDKNGNKVYTTDFVAEDQEFAESKSSNNDGFSRIDAQIDIEEELPFGAVTR